MDGTISTVLCCGLPVVILVAAVAKKIREQAATAERQSNKAELESNGVVEARVGLAVALLSNPPRVSIARTDRGRDIWPLTHDMVVSVEEAGSITAVRGRDLAAKAVGGVLTFGAGFFVFGNAKTQEVERRELYIIFESATVAQVAKVDPELGHEARQFAATVNLAARQLGDES